MHRLLPNARRGFVTAALLCGAAVLLAGCGREDSVQRDIRLANERRDNPVEAVKQQLSDCISRYHHGDVRALPFLSSGATNISVVRVTRSDSTNLPSVDAVLLVDGKRHYLEIPISVFPTVFLETLPPPPTEAEVREHVNQQVQHLLKGEKSDLLLSSAYQWTNIVIESIIIPTNFTQRYPYNAEVVLLAQGLALNTKTPLQYRSRLDIGYMEEDRWVVIPRQTAP